MGHPESLGQWLKERCSKEDLSLRAAAAKTGLSHATIAEVINGSSASPGTIKRLAHAFSNGKNHQKMMLEDQLLTLAGYRTRRPEGEGISEPMARLLDKLSDLSEPQLKMIGRFVDFLGESEGK